MNPLHRKIFIVVFSLAIALRLLLCIFNREANDDHMEAINLIADKKAIPESWECAECFQPKAFYLLSAGLILAFDVDSPDARIIAVQMLNLLLSFLILLFTWKFINSKAFSDRVKLLAFSLAALNPTLLGINAQVTNDTIIILLGVLVIYYADRFFSSGSLRDGLWLTFFSVLSPVVKGSGIVIMIAVLILFVIHILFSKGALRSQFIRIGLLTVFTTAVIVPFAGGYYYSYVNYGTPFSTGIGPKSNVKVVKDAEPFQWRPGIQSVKGGYLTFRLMGMLEQPYINDDPVHFPLHRTSVWSQLYGRTFFMHFDQHPPSWKNTSPVILNTGRAALLLGLVPTALLIIGFMTGAFLLITKYQLRIQEYFSSTDWHFLVFAVGFIGFIVLYTRDYPDFSTMKSVFLLPALPAFLLALMRGMEFLRSPGIKWGMVAAVSLLCCIHVFDSCFLIGQLWPTG